MDNKPCSVCVVIVAAGRGSRMNSNVNKQYIDICGKPLLARTISAFEDCPEIDGIVLVADSEEINYCKQHIIDKYSFQKISAIAKGGATRQESVYSGLKCLTEGCRIVLIHDGARPFIKNEVIKSCIEGANEFKACCAAVPVKDTIKSSDADNFVKSTIDRSNLWSIQTPQAFQADIILKSHEYALKSGFCGTDDCMLAEYSGEKIKIVMGDYLNIKITTPEDLIFAESIFKMWGNNK